MSHEKKQFDNILTVGAPAWHKLDDNRQFATLADVVPILDYPVYCERAHVNVAPFKPAIGISAAQEFIPVLGRKATFTVDPNTGNVITFTTVSDQYKVYQNRDAIDLLAPYESAGCKVETAGTLKNKAIAWILLKIPGDSLNIGGDDTIDKYILWSNAHDGSAAVRVGLTLQRVVCNNTITAAHERADSQLIRVFHSGAVVDNVRDVADLIDTVNFRLAATEEKFKALAKREINTKDLHKIVKQVFNLTALEKQFQATPDAEGVITVPAQSDLDLMAKQAKIVANLERIYETAPGQDLPTAKGTAWGVYNAITYHLTHERGRTADSRLMSNWFGDSSALNRKALAACLELVTV